MRANPIRTAWVILLSSFFVCLLLAVSVPLSVRWYLLHGTQERPGLLRVASGTVLLVTQQADEPIAVVDSRPVEDETLIRTDQSSQATLLFQVNAEDESPELATIQIYPNVQLRLLESSRPRFSLSRDPDRIVLELLAGRVRIIAADYQPRGLVTQVKTPEATIYLDPGSYAVEVKEDQTQVVTRFGRARVDAAGIRRLVEDGLSSIVLAGQPPSDPAPLAENLIADGDFSNPLGPPNWLISRYPEDDPSAGNAEVVRVGARRAVRFFRLNQPPTHTEIGITQVLDRNVSDYEYLSLQLDVLLRWQSLPGAGERSSEFPLMFWIDYQDIYGNHQFWTHGFYYRDPPEQWVVTGGEKVPLGIWFPFESGNLFERLPMEGRPPPAIINWIKIYASGHNYDSMVSEVRLIAR